MIIAATGHRPDKLGGYGNDVMTRLIDLAAGAFKVYQPAGVISGLALGWDTAIAIAAIRAGIPLCASIPFVGQENRWSSMCRQRYAKILSLAATVCVSSKTGVMSAFQDRNVHMVDNSDLLLALYNGSSGGTRNCIRYATGKTRIVNLWASWEAHK